MCACVLIVYMQIYKYKKKYDFYRMIWLCQLDDLNVAEMFFYTLTELSTKGLKIFLYRL